MFAMQSSATALLTWSLLVSPSSAFWRLLCDNPVTVGRYDPIVSPGNVAGHVHTISGGSGFSMSSTYADLRASSCTSCQIQQDKSAYWIPNLYYQGANNGTFEEVPTIGGMTVYYLQRGNNIQQMLPGEVNAFPPGFQMLAGNPALRSAGQSLEQQAINYVCLDYAAGSSESPGLPTKNCPQGLRAQVVFPSCWDGVNMDSANHKSHMAYPTAVSSGTCPASHPVRLVTVFMEVTFEVDRFASRWYNGRAQPFVFAQGDATGYGLHGDFQNGWDPAFLQQAINTCTSSSGKQEDCPLFDLKYGQQCHVTPQVNELVNGSPLPKLPGCNPVTFDAGAKAACTEALPEVWNTTSQYLGLTAPPTSKFLSNQAQTRQAYDKWQFVGCYEDSYARALPNAVGVQGDMTVSKCLDACTASGFKFGGIEAGQECWCSSVAPTSKVLTYAGCGAVCKGNSTELCGGSWALSVYNNTGAVAPTIPLSSTDRTSDFSGCYQDNPNRLMQQRLATNGTVDGCVAACRSAGFPVAGIQYYGECYCAASKPASSLLIGNDQCSFKCSGDKTTLCGGSYALQVYSSRPVPTTALPSSASASATALSSAGANAFTYKGCYSDSGNARSLRFRFSSDGTNAGCAAVCKAKGYSIAATQYASECWCDNVISALAQKVPESDCSMACSDNSAEKCGNGYRLSVYSSVALISPAIPQVAAGMVYAGCWTDDAQRVMKQQSNVPQTVGACALACLASGFAQAAVQYGGECYCGPLAARSTKVADSECSMYCNGDATSSTFCGAGYRLQLYKVPTLSIASSSAAPSTTRASTLSSTSAAATANVLGQVANFALAAPAPVLSSSSVSVARSTLTTVSKPAVAPSSSSVKLSTSTVARTTSSSVKPTTSSTSSPSSTVEPTSTSIWKTSTLTTTRLSTTSSSSTSITTSSSSIVSSSSVRSSTSSRPATAVVTPLAQARTA